MYRIKNKITKEIFYFRFFGSSNAKEIWYTPTIEACGFNRGNIGDFIPLDKSWEELQNEGL